MVQVIFNGEVIAEAPKKDIQMVEGNMYFPHDAIKKQFYTPTDLHTVCGWKGTADYYTISAGGKTATNAAWYYPNASTAAKKITNYVAFYKTKVSFKN